MASSSSSIPNQAEGAAGGAGDGNPPQQQLKTDQSSQKTVPPFPIEMLPDLCRFMSVEELWKLADVSSEWRTVVLPFIMERTMNVEDGAVGGRP